MSAANGTLSQLFSAYSKTSYLGNVIFNKGESGIGKTYWSTRFIELAKGDAYFVNINGIFLDQSAYNTINSAVYKHISSHLLNQEIALNLLQKIAAGLPRFGQYISPFFDTNKKYDALINLIKKSGINPHEPNVFNIIDFFESLAKKQKIILICDNIQWFDKDSFNLIFNLLAVIADHNWFCIINYTTNAEVQQVSHYELGSLISQLSSQYEHVSFLEMRRLDKDEIFKFCSDVLGFPINLTPNQIDIVFEYSKGLPYYVKTIVQILKERGLIYFENGIWKSKHIWHSEYIKELLKDCIKERILTIYQKIPGSRDALEIASVFGEEFDEDSINSLFEGKDSFLLFSNVEAKFRLIHYLTDERYWIFEHSLVQNYIYQSLGTKAKDLHLKIAKYLTKTTVAYLKIAMHFRQAGDFENAIQFELKEIEQLLNAGCYRSAAQLSEKIENDWVGLFVLSNDKKIQYEILKGKIRFHIVQYEAAIELFTTLLGYNNCSENITAQCHHWIGRAFLKLSTQSDFKLGLDHLIQAKELYNKLNLEEDLGIVYSDLVVAYAHLNNISKAELAFKQAEHYFNNTKNIVGMLRLQRRSIIFMPPKLSAPLLMRAGDVFKKMNLQHEQIMTYNNAATQLIYAGDMDKADMMLQDALATSINLDGFGQVYIYNNLGIISYIKGDFVEASRYFESGRKGKFRLVEQLIIDVNESVVLLVKSGPVVMEPLLYRLYQKALDVGENDYIVPTGLNFAKCLVRMGNLSKGKSLLIELKEKVNLLNSDYEKYLWYSALNECFAMSNDLENLKKLKDEISVISRNNAELYPIYKSDYSLITMQFWSDN